MVLAARKFKTYLVSRIRKNENRIDYIMINKRYRNSIKNAKARQGADCGSDHNPVVINIKTILKRVKKSESTRKQWNVSNLNQEIIKEKYKQESEKLIDATDHGESVEEIWKIVKSFSLKQQMQFAAKEQKQGNKTGSLWKY